MLLNTLDESKKDLQLEAEKVDNINSQLGELEAQLYKHNQNFQFSKADMDAQRYKYEEALFGYGNAEEEEKKYIQLQKATDKFFLIAENTQIKIDDLNNQLKLINENIKNIHSVDLSLRFSLD